MEREYSFRRIEKEEVPVMFALIRQRMQWMDEQGIDQWNTVAYDTIYPLAYYEQQRQAGRVFVLAEQATGRIDCAAVLLEQDDRWPQAASAVYLHNFVSRLGSRGAGEVFLRFAEEYARSRGKRYLRLDSDKDNLALARYYQRQGFCPAGTCAEGPYRGILRQKKLE